MQVAFGRTMLPAVLGHAPHSPAMAIGNFDGVHRGHRRLLEIARDLAARRQAEVGVLTFDPHPARVLAPTLAPPLIAPLARRLELIAEAGADFTVVEPFTPELARVEADTFVRKVLAEDLGARDVVVGYDFSFGRGRAGNAALLVRLGEALGMGVTVVPPVAVGGLTCSSTKIREFVLEGRMGGAALLLGRPFELAGEVVRGAGRGRTIGVPTANLRVDGELLPRAGVYAARARLLDRAPLLAAVNVGTNPTFDAGGGTSVEAHLLDFEGELYGERLRLELVERLRDERRFPTPDALVRQIADDIEGARQVLR